MSIFLNFRKFHDVPIKHKLMAIILATSGVVLLLATTAFVTNELLSFRQSMVTDSLTLGDLVGLNSSGGLLFMDPTTTTENLAALQVKPHVVVAHVFTKDGELFATYLRGVPPASHDEPLPKLPQNAPDGLPIHHSLSELTADYQMTANDSQISGYFFHANHLGVFRPVFFQDEFVGTVYIRSDLEAFNERLISAAGIVLTVLLASLGLAFFIASRLQNVITAPVYQLLETISEVSRNKDYRVRAVPLGRDELGTLVDGFNSMLAQVQARDCELTDYREHLEEQVAKRTVELAEARDQALAANKAKSVFLANMSHEIRTPMNAVLGYAQIMLRDKSLNREHRNTMQIIQNSGNHLLSLINDILDISKIEAGAMELRLEDFLLDDLIDGISTMFNIRCEQSGLEWRVESEIPQGNVVYGDQGKLRQIFINLLGNAVKFTERGSVTLRAMILEDSNRYRFVVVDTGPGIPPEQQARIFDPFQQESAGYDKGGTGLGLAITKRQVEMMEGCVWVESELGHGSHFIVELPLPPGDVATLSVSEDQNRDILSMAPGTQVDALVVDDIQENRNILSHMLREVGVDVREAGDGLEAWKAIQQQAPDILFSDIRMPHMDGMALARKIRAEFQGKMFIRVAITASTLHHQTQHVLDAGFDAFVSKPFHFQEVYHCMEEFLQVRFIYADSIVEENTDVGRTAPCPIPVELEPNLEQRLREAIDLNELTELETLVEELRGYGETQGQLADALAERLGEYDVDGMLEILNQVLNPTDAPCTEPPAPKALDLAQVKLPHEVYDRLRDAAELNELTELEQLIGELRGCGEHAALLADQFEQALLEYDIDGITETLEHIQPNG